MRYFIAATCLLGFSLTLSGDVKHLKRDISPINNFDYEPVLTTINCKEARCVEEISFPAMHFEVEVPSN